MVFVQTTIEFYTELIEFGMSDDNHQTFLICITQNNRQLLHQIPKKYIVINQIFERRRNTH